MCKVQLSTYPENGGELFVFVYPQLSVDCSHELLSEASERTFDFQLRGRKYDAFLDCRETISAVGRRPHGRRICRDVGVDRRGVPDGRHEHRNERSRDVPEGFNATPDGEQLNL